MAVVEMIRRSVRGRLGATSTLYRTAARLYSDLVIARREGPSTLVRLRRLQTARPAPPQPMTFAALSHPFYLRPGTSDIPTAIDNFVRREYGEFALPATLSYMVDAGAYIGDTSAYFLSRFPALRVCALEPSAESYALSQQNLAPYGDRVTVLQAALAGQAGRLRLSGHETGATIHGQAAADAEEVEATTVPDLLAAAPDGRIDLLKMDIEGAERDVFEADIAGWVDRVAIILVEPHGAEIEHVMQDRMAAHGWTFERRRNLFCFRNPKL